MKTEFQFLRVTHLRMVLGSADGTTSVDFPAHRWNTEMDAAMAAHSRNMRARDTLAIGFRHNLPISQDDHREVEFAHEVIAILDQWNQGDVL